MHFNMYIHNVHVLFQLGILVAIKEGIYEFGLHSMNEARNSESSTTIRLTWILQIPVKKQALRENDFMSFCIDVFCSSHFQPMRYKTTFCSRTRGRNTFYCRNILLHLTVETETVKGCLTFNEITVEIKCCRKLLHMFDSIFHGKWKWL